MEVVFNSSKLKALDKIGRWKQINVPIGQIITTAD